MSAMLTLLVCVSSCGLCVLGVCRGGVVNVCGVMLETCAHSMQHVLDRCHARREILAHSGYVVQRWSPVRSPARGCLECVWCLSGSSIVGV